ncbi:MAG: hypothetical protein NTW28_12915 [Candidatus Solibacter sp.]|nr:hypothetical protein [Candidatus Solibacter sp.]
MISRSFLAAVCLATSSFAAPPLTKIQDVLYKADGTRFNGTVTISWSSFEAIDRSVIAQQTTTVTVVNGNLQVQLVPSTTATPASFYTAVYNSDGRIQFQETWAVPSSVQPLRVRDVRVSILGGVGAEVGGATVQESDVVGLISDLGARPLKGPGYAAGRVAYVNPTGAIETVDGTPTDCVRVDGSSGPCGGTQPSFVDSDSPAGLVDGANTAFTLSGVPSPAASLTVYRNGMLQKTGQDFTLSGNRIDFVAAAAPQGGDTLVASFRLTGGTDNTPRLYPNPQVLCSGLGGATNSSTLASVGICNIPAGFLAAGDRVEIRFDLDHPGTAGGFTFEVHWGATTVLTRNASAVDAQAKGWAEAALTAAGAQLSHQSWGTSLAFAAGVGKSTDDSAGGIAVDFLASTVQSAETVTLKNFTVVRFP